VRSGYGWDAFDRLAGDFWKQLGVKCGVASRALFISAFALVDLWACGAGHAASSQCTRTESTLFTCRMGNNVVSVCASELSAGAGLVQYRYGPRGKPNFRFPSTAQDWRAKTRTGTLTFAGGGGAYMAFSNPPYRYVVYTAIGRGWGQTAGVAVEKDGKLIRNLKCSTELKSELGPNLFDEAGFRSDQDGFELP
jgi:hypothetical protein